MFDSSPPFVFSWGSQRRLRTGPVGGVGGEADIGQLVLSEHLSQERGVSYHTSEGGGDGGVPHFSSRMKSPNGKIRSSTSKLLQQHKHKRTACKQLLSRPAKLVALLLLGREQSRRQCLLPCGLTCFSSSWCSGRSVRERRPSRGRNRPLLSAEALGSGLPGERRMRLRRHPPRCCHRSSTP